jgi:hypothetical protein
MRPDCVGLRNDWEKNCHASVMFWDVFPITMRAHWFFWEKYENWTRGSQEPV